LLKITTLIGSAVMNSPISLLKPAVTSENDYLPVAVQRLNSVGLRERRADCRVVERADNALGSVLADPVPGPKSIQARVEYERSVVLGQIADRTPTAISLSLLRVGFYPAFRPIFGVREATLSKNLASDFAFTLSRSNFRVGRAEPVTPRTVGVRRPSTIGRSSIWMTLSLAGKKFEYG
jgi:hypothetical protein